uniref:3-hydroxybutyrate dehydrogenase, type 1 n=1 Tax=Gasterosteus aculeatus TaxID=69293 RepID=G3NHC5_GASAC
LKGVIFTAHLNVMGVLCSNHTWCLLALCALSVLQFVRDISATKWNQMVKGKAVFITGCDTGFGHALAKHLHKLGFTVFAGCLFKDKGAEGAKELEELCSDRLKVVQLDVCSDEQVDQAVKYVKENLGDTETSLWAVVNNAGVSTFGEIEFTSMDTYRRVSEVNLWGTVRVTKAFLPLIRRAKGRVVNVASMSGRMGCPSQSAYCVSKYGVEAFSDCLRYEMKAWGVKVSVIEPGNFLAATSIMTRDSVAVTAAKLWREAPTQVQEDYGKARFEIHMAATRSHCNTGQKDAASVLDDITDAVVSKRPYTRYHPMEPHSWLRVQLMTHLPGAMSDFLYF